MQLLRRNNVIVIIIWHHDTNHVIASVHSYPSYWFRRVAASIWIRLGPVCPHTSRCVIIYLCIWNPSDAFSPVCVCMLSQHECEIIHPARKRQKIKHLLLCILHAAASFFFIHY